MKRIDGKYVAATIEQKNIINSKDRVEVNWSAIGAVSVPEAERFATEVLRVCAEARIQAGKLNIDIKDEQ